MDLSGHVKLTDFGLCKQRKSRDEVNESICGSADYICPEMLTTREHTRMIDFY